jgi:hypothetical protein
MNKKHFIALADTIREIDRRDAEYGFSKEELRKVFLLELGNFCMAQNHNFDRERWLGYIAGTNGPNGGRK